MELNNYGITLKPLHENDIEMVRLWRNSSHVRQYMQYKNHISIEMQKRWFKSLDNKKDFFFIIYHNNYPIGLTEIKHIDKYNNGNLGIFIADSESLKIPMISYRAIFAIIDFAFYELELNEIIASILPDNNRAIRFNESFGFEKSLKNIDKLLYYTLTQENYKYKSSKIKKILLR